MKNTQPSKDRALAASAGDAAPDPTGRTPKDYAIEHAGFMATYASRFLAAYAEHAALQLRDAESDDVSDHDRYDDQVDMDEAARALRDSIHEFSRRRDRALAASAGEAAPSDPFQNYVQPWLMACFGEEIANDREERNHRFLEEALELVQSCGCTASEAHQLVDYVFGRPVGEPAQEVGGVMVTLAALCLANGLDMHEAGEVELARIWTKVDAIRAKQAAKPKHSPLPAAAPSAPAAPQVAALDGLAPWLRVAAREADAENAETLRAWAAEVEAVRVAAPQVAAAPAITRNDIRAVFMAHGFVVKDGQTDLKEYVYRAAEHLLELAASQLAAAPKVAAPASPWGVGCLDSGRTLTLHFDTPEDAAAFRNTVQLHDDADRAAQAACDTGRGA